MTKWAILADIHGNLPALEAVLADLQGRRLDGVINLGDHASGPLWPAETLNLLRAQNWVHIAGNHDRQLISVDPARQGASDRYAYENLAPEHLAWLRALPPTLAPRADVLAFHGTPGSDCVYLLETVEHGRAHLAAEADIRARLKGASAPLMLCAHTHVPRAVLLGDALIVNPGSVGLPAYSDDTPEPHVIETGSPQVRYALLDDDLGGWRVTLRSLSYDHAAAARQAARQGRTDWERALLTGRLSA